jgi:hypothetical protein
MYDAEIITETAPEDRYELEAGRAVAFPLTIGAGEAKRIIGIHTWLNAQDHSVRVWVSSEVSGLPLGPTVSEFWQLNRVAGETVLVHDEDRVVTERTAKGPIAVPPGTYYVNFLNLVNTKNGFLYRIEEE